MSTAGPGPVGPPPDLPHDTLQPNLIAASVVTWVVAAVFVALRFHTRVRVINALNSSDWCILVALIFSAATCAGEAEAAVHGAGRHIWDLDLNDVQAGIRWARAAWYALLFYTLTLCFSKISILLLYIHIFAFQWLRRCGQLVLAIVILSNVYMVIAVFTACIPLQSYWDKSIPSTYCHAQSVWWSNTGLLMVTDFMIFLLPMPAVWTLRLPRRQRYILLGIFGLGFFVCLISIIRLKYLVDVIDNPPIDFFYDTSPLTYWTVVEINGAIVCACLMTLKPLVTRLFPRLFSSGHSSSSKAGSGNGWNPPTIGSKPSRDPFSAAKSPRMRGAPSLEEIRESHDAGGADPFAAAVELEESVGMAEEDASTSSLTATGTGAGDETTNSSSTMAVSTRNGGSLSPPPRTHLKPPGGQRMTAFYESASESEGYATRYPSGLPDDIGKAQ